MSKSIHSNRQKGAALLIFFLILFTTSAAVLLRAVNNANFGLAAANNTQQEMVRAKEALLAFAMSYAENFAGGPPGRLPCIDSDNDADGLPNIPCNANNNPGRLPTRVTLGPDNSFALSDHGIVNGQRFWYAVSPAYRQSSTAILNSNVPGTLSLDGQGDIVAMLIAPGDALSGQTRPNNVATNYLESSNAAGTVFVSNLPANPTAFNDRVLPIYRHEVMTLVTARVVQMFRPVLNAYHPMNGNSYPLDKPAFLAAIAAAAPPAPAWFLAHDWDDEVNYGFVNANTVNISFNGCAITYQLVFSPSTISRSQSSCEVSP